jgi:YVTN family beta-propeller protein
MRDKRHVFQRILLLICAMLLFGEAIVNPMGDAQVATPTPLPLYFLPDARTNRAYISNTLALTNDGRTLIATNMLNGTISIISVAIANQGQVQAEIPVGRDPRGLALTPDNSRVVVVNRGDNTLSVINMADQSPAGTINLGGALPYAIVIPDNEMAYVTLQGSNEVVVISLSSQQVMQRIPVPSRPAGLALWGDVLYVTHFETGQVSLIYVPSGRVIETVSTGIDVGASQMIELDVTRGVAYLPETRSNVQNTRFTFDSIVFPVVNVLDLHNLTLQPEMRITLDTADRPVNMPFATALDRFRNWLFVANAGSNDVSVIDLKNGLARAHIDVGSNPRGLLLNRDNSFLFVHNVLDGTITVIDTDRMESVDVLPISNPAVPVDILLGAQFFHSAVDPRLSAERWVSCANCHFDGLPDGRTWQGFADGPRNTPPLFNLIETAPYNWSATWDEVADVELKIRDLQAGTGLIEDFPVSDALGSPHAGLSPDLDTLVVYLTSLQGPSNPNRSDTEQAERGAEVFDEQKCAECHVGPAGTNLQAYDVGTGDPALEKHGQTFDTPSLRYLWLTAPYFHDGSAAGLRDVFMLSGRHRLIQTVTPEDIDALIDYLLSWQ